MDEKPSAEADQKFKTKLLMDGMIRVGLIASLIFFCIRVFLPFLGRMMWGLVLAVMLYSVQQSLARRMGNRQGRSATLLVLVVGCLLIGIPLVYLSSSVAQHIQHAHVTFEANELSIKPFRLQSSTNLRWINSSRLFKMKGSV
jgi:predicted PurR-regulated permease PerM